MRVLISGGGIAGLTLAYWLHHHHISSVVIEQAERIHHGGYGLDFYGTGYDVAERMGILERLRQQQIPFEEVAYVNAAGQNIACIDIALMRNIMHNKYMALMHWTLEERLYEAIADKVEVRFGTRLTAIDPGPKEVAATFSDGTTETFDMLIGADGIHSQTRRLIFGDDALFEHYLGYSFASYNLLDNYEIGHTWKNYVEPGRLTGAYCSNQDGKIVTFLMYKTADEGYIPQEQRLPRLQRAFAGMGWITPRLLQDLTDPDTIFLDTMTQIRMPRWHQGRVALVGDACGCPTSLSGQGASLAMGGAYVLAQALQQASGYETAFTSYEQRMRPHVEQRQKNARGSAKTFLPTSKLGIVTQQLFMKLLLREGFSGLLRRQFGAESLLQTQPSR